MNENDEEEVVILKNENKVKSFLKAYFVLILMVSCQYGNSFIYDNPAALQDVMKDALHIEYSTISSFYSWYSWPNVILCVVNGYIIDRVIGYRSYTIVLTSLVAVGQLLFCFGAFNRIIWLMQVARVVYGIGAEPIQMCLFKYASKWFKSRNGLNTAVGAVYCIPSLGSVLNMSIMVPIYEKIVHSMNLSPQKSLGLALLTSAAVALFSVLTAIWLAYLDKKENHIDKDNTQSFNIRNVLTFPSAFWFVCIICILYYACIFPYIGSVKTFYILKYGLSTYSANLCNSLTYVVASFTCPFTGFIIDFVGHNLFCLFMFTLVTFGIHCCIAFTYLSPYICSTVIGLCYSFTSTALWPMVALIIKDDKLGTAYGVMQSIQNFGLAIANLFVGYVIDRNGYFILELIYMTILGACLICIVILFHINDIKGLPLNRNNRTFKSDIPTNIQIEKNE